MSNSPKPAKLINPLRFQMKRGPSFLERRVFKRSCIITQSSTLCFWSPTYGEFLGRRGFPVKDYVRGRSNLCQISANQLCCGDAHGRLFFLNLTQLVENDRIITQAHHNDVQCVASTYATNRNSHDPYVLSAYRKVKLWRFRRKKKSEYSTKNFERIMSMAVASKNCSMFATASRNLVVRYYDISRQQPLLSFQSHNTDEFKFHPHHHLQCDVTSFQIPVLASSAVDTLKMYTVLEKEPVITVRYYVHFLQTFCLFPEKYMAIAGDTEGTIYCTDWRKPDRFVWSVGKAHSGAILNIVPNSCVFDNKFYSFVTSSASGSMTVRKVRDGSVLCRFSEWERDERALRIATITGNITPSSSFNNVASLSSSSPSTATTNKSAFLSPNVMFSKMKKIQKKNYSKININELGFIPPPKDRESLEAVISAEESQAVRKLPVHGLSVFRYPRSQREILELRGNRSWGKRLQELIVQLPSVRIRIFQKKKNKKKKYLVCFRLLLYHFSNDPPPNNINGDDDHNDSCSSLLHDADKLTMTKLKKKKKKMKKKKKNHSSKRRSSGGTIIHRKRRRSRTDEIIEMSASASGAESSSSSSENNIDDSVEEKQQQEEEDDDEDGENEIKPKKKKRKRFSRIFLK